MLSPHDARLYVAALRGAARGGRAAHSWCAARKHIQEKAEEKREAEKEALVRHVYVEAPACAARVLPR